MTRWKVWAPGLALAGLVAGGLAPARVAAQLGETVPVTITTPKDGATVREKVKIVVPREAVPDQGFAGVYIDNRFKAALAPPSPEDEVTAEGAPVPKPKPLVYFWDTKEADSDPLLTDAQRYFPDGPHVVEVRVYNGMGELVSGTRANVTLANKINVRSDQPVRLAYGGKTGESWHDVHHVELTANAGDRGFARVTRNNPFTRLTHKEVTRYLLAIEDISPPFNEQYIRERREPVVELETNAQRLPMKLDASSVYYTMSQRGRVRPSSLMKRVKREPFANIIDLPGRTVRMNDGPFETTVRVHCGTYIPAVLTIEKAQAQIEGMEWEAGVPAVRIGVKYNAGEYKISVLNHGIYNADFKLEQGKSTIWFSEKLGRVVRAEHDITGVLKAPLPATAGGVVSGAPIEGAPGAPGMPVSPYGAPGASPYGAPGGEQTSAGISNPYGGAPGVPGVPGAPGDPGAYGGTPGYAQPLTDFHVTLKVSTEMER